MGWEDTHLHEFDINGERFGVQDKDGSDDGLRSEKGVRLNHALGSATEFEYHYDFGDDWQHRVIVESVGYPDLALALPVCLAGENACPPEDVGGPHGYADFLAALGDKTHEQHNDFRSWVGGVFDPVGFDVNAVNARLRAIR